MKLSLKLRFVLPVTIGIFAILIGLISVTASTAVVLRDTEEYVVRKVRAELTQAQGTVEQFMNTRQVDEVLRAVSTFGSFEGVNVMLFGDSDGQVRASTRYQDTDKDWLTLGYGIKRELISHVVNFRGIEVEVTGDAELVHGYASVCYQGEGTALRAQNCGFLYYQVELAPFRQRALESVRYQAAVDFAGMLILSGLLWTLLHHILTRRAARLVVTAQAYAAGDRAKRARMQGEDELSQVGASIDDMLDKLVRDERALQEREARLNAVFNTVADPIIIIDQGGIISGFNASAERVFGYALDEVVGQNVKMLMPEPYRSAHDGYLARCSARGEIDPSVFGKERQLMGVRKSGEVFPIELTVTAIKEGDVCLAVGVIRDITERKKAEEGLLLAQRVFENTTEAILITDKDARIIDVNQAYQAITGYTKDEVLGRNPGITRSGRHDRDFYQAMWQSVNTTGSWSGEIWDRRKSGEVFPKWLTINAIKNKFGETTHYVGIFTDITQLKDAENKLEQLAYYDPLTKLPNRALFFDRLRQALEQAKRKSTKMALLFIDLDRFKYVNDTLGHNIGDLMLVEVAGRITRCLRKTDTVARLGGDEFTVILGEIQRSTNTEKIAQDIIDALQRKFDIAGHEIYVGASVGIAIYPEDGADLEVLVKNADIAMYQAKSAGRGNYKFFTPELNAASQRRAELENDLRKAIADEEFTLYYQPKFALKSRRLVGLEALIRWVHPVKGIVSPAEFIPVAEETGCILQIDQWVLEAATRQLKQWYAQTGRVPRVSVNLSARQFEHTGLVGTVERALGDARVAPGLLELEITEGVIMKDAKAASLVLSRLREMGVFISVDDFGTGYSSLSYLKKLPLHVLKIDRSFIMDIERDDDDKAIVASIISMGHSLNLEVLAEGIETEGQLRLLSDMGCDLGQGYLFSRPVPAEELGRWLEKCD
ncbi:MAG: EAL domain-containing protein [Pseudomonadota bacterium]